MTKLVNRRYAIIKTLGTGGMGQVYLVEDQHQQETVALKVLDLATTAKTSSFLAEFQLLSRLNHPRLVQVYECGQVVTGPQELRGRQFFTMEALAGTNLVDLELPEDVEEAMRVLDSIASQTLEGLAAIHTAGIIHRDVKGENVFFTHDGQVKLLDFGLAQVSNNSQQIPGNVAKVATGSPGYWAPEVRRGGHCEPRSDLYSLGVTLYFLVTSRLPDPTHLIPIRQLCPDVSEQWARATEVLLQSEPRERPANAVAAAKQFGCPWAHVDSKPFFAQAPLVGRDSELASIQEQLNSETCEPLIWLTGEAGVGKSRFVEELAMTLRVNGWLVNQAVVTAAAYSAFSSLIRHLLNSGEADGVIASELQAIAGSQTQFGQGHLVGHDEENSKPRLSFLDRICGFILESTRLQPTILIIDDASRLDSASRDLLAYLIRACQLTGPRFVCLLVDRKQSYDFAPRYFSMRLERLSRPHIVQLVTTVLRRNDEAGLQLADRCGGLPSFAVALARGDNEIVRNVEERLVEDFSALDEVRQTLVLTMAMVGRPFRLVELANITPLSPTEVIDGVGELLRAGMVRRVGTASEVPKYGLIAPQVAEKIVAGVDPIQRQGLGQIVFESLAQSGARIEEIAKLAIAIDHPKAASFCERAADACMLVHAERDAKQFLYEAMARAQVPEQSHKLKLKLAQLWYSRGRLDDAFNQYQSLMVSADLAIRSEASLLGAKILRARGELDVAQELIKEALYALAGALEDPLLIRSRAELQILSARISSTQGHYADSANTCQSAQDALPESFKNSSLGLFIEIEYCLNRILSLDTSCYDELRQRLIDALACFEKHKDEEGRSLALKALGLLCFYSKDERGAESYYLKALEALGQSGFLSLGLLNNLAMVALELGDPATAESRLEQCLSASERMGSSNITCRALTNLGRLRREQGDYAGALRAFFRAAKVARQSNEPIIESAALSELGATQQLLKQVKDALTAFKAARKIRLVIGDPMRFATSEFDLGRLWEQVQDINAATQHYRTALALVNAKNALANACDIVLAILYATRRPSGPAAILRYVWTQKTLDVPQEFESLAAQGRTAADLAYALAAILVARSANDFELAERIMQGCLRHTIDGDAIYGEMRSLEFWLSELISQFGQRKPLHEQPFIENLPPQLTNFLALQRAFESARSNKLEQTQAELERLCVPISKEMSLETRFLKARLKVLNPQSEASQERPRDVFVECMSQTQSRRDFLLGALAASDLASLHATHRQFDDSQQARSQAHHFAAELTADLPADMRETWTRKLVTTRVNLDQQQSPQDHLIPLIERVLASDLSLDPLLDLVIGLLVEVTGARRGFLVLRDQDSRLDFKASRNIKAENVIGERGFKGSFSIAQAVAESMECVLISDVRIDSRFQTNLSLAESHAISVLAAPILDKNEVIGVVYLDHDSVQGAFQNEELDLVNGFNRKIASTVEHARKTEAALREAEARAAALRREVARLAGDKVGVQRLLGESESMRAIRRLIPRFAEARAPVLILGESGTGKELVARALHEESSRANQSFIAVNCAAFARDLLEAELFGYVRGAFTGALENRSGLIEAANHGTLFLDELGDMDLAMQGKLLRVLANSEIRRIGETRTRPIDVRVVAATHRPIAELVASGEFRQDLYFRLNVLKVDLPPLRKRRDDIPILAGHLLRSIEQSHQKSYRISPGGMKALKSADLPGNVRELKNLIQRATIMTTGTVLRAEHLILEGSTQISDSQFDLSKLNPRQRKLVQDLEKSERAITTREHCEAHDISERTGLRDLQQLVKKEILRKIGSRKSAKYMLLRDYENQFENDFEPDFGRSESEGA